jgi:hypothetical protein
MIQYATHMEACANVADGERGHSGFTGSYWMGVALQKAGLPFDGLSVEEQPLSAQTLKQCIPDARRSTVAVNTAMRNAMDNQIQGLKFVADLRCSADEEKVLRNIVLSNRKNICVYLELLRKAVAQTTLQDLESLAKAEKPEDRCEVLFKFATALEPVAILIDGSEEKQELIGRFMSLVMLHLAFPDQKIQGLYDGVMTEEAGKALISALEQLSDKNPKVLAQEIFLLTIAQDLGSRLGQSGDSVGAAFVALGKDNQSHSELSKSFLESDYFKESFRD